MHGRPVGLRTHLIVAMAAATFMVISSQFVYFQHYGHDDLVAVDSSRIAASVVSGIGDHPFVAIGGEEVTMLGARRQVHVNAICTHGRLPGGRFASAQRALTFGVGEIREVGGVALVNHPNFTWGIASSDLPSALGAQLLEIQSGHPAVRTKGNFSHPSHEALWDMALTAGLDFMGVAVDDAHYLRTPGRARVIDAHGGTAWTPAVRIIGGSERPTAADRTNASPPPG